MKLLHGFVILIMVFLARNVQGSSQPSAETDHSKIMKLTAKQMITFVENLQRNPNINRNKAEAFLQKALDGKVVILEKPPKELSAETFCFYDANECPDPHCMTCDEDGWCWCSTCCIAEPIPEPIPDDTRGTQPEPRAELSRPLAPLAEPDMKKGFSKSSVAWIKSYDSGGSDSDYPVITIKERTIEVSHNCAGNCGPHDSYVIATQLFNTKNPGIKYQLKPGRHDIEPGVYKHYVNCHLVGTASGESVVQYD